MREDLGRRMETGGLQALMTSQALGVEDVLADEVVELGR